MSDSTKNFSGRAEDYTVGRPTYAKEFIEYLYDKATFVRRSLSGSYSLKEDDAQY